MKPWVDSLRYLSKASIGFVKTAMGLKAGDDDAVCANYVSAENNYKLSQNCAAPQLNGTDHGRSRSYEDHAVRSTDGKLCEESSTESAG